MKTIATLAAAAFVFAVGSASACEWNKTAEQSVQSPDNSKMASVTGPQTTGSQTTPVKK